jgi:hypothetical protein
VIVLPVSVQMFVLSWMPFASWVGKWVFCDRALPGIRIPALKQLGRRVTPDSAPFADRGVTVYTQLFERRAMARAILDKEDRSVSVNLEALSSVGFQLPAFRAPTDFSIRALIAHGDTASLFLGSFDGQAVFLEPCTRIPFRLVCREISLLASLNIRQLMCPSACTRHPSLGVVTLAYLYFDFVPWTEQIPPQYLHGLLQQLLRILGDLHRENVHHSWVCRSSIFVTTDYQTVVLGSSHAAAKIGEAAPFVPTTPCSPPQRNDEDRRTDDVYAAGMWFLSFFGGDTRTAVEELPPPVREVLVRMIDPDPRKRPTSSDALPLLQRARPD